MLEHRARTRQRRNPNRTGIYMDVMESIIRDLNESPELQQIFGVPVSRALAVIADHNDLRIEDGGRVLLNRLQQREFLAILDRVIRENSV